jgi:hypothetical protein
MPSRRIVPTTAPFLGDFKTRMYAFAPLDGLDLFYWLYFFLD